MAPSAAAIASRSCVDRLDQPPDPLGHALLVEQEAAAGALEQPRVEQRDRRMDHRVAVLERGLHHALGLLDRRPDVLDEVVEPVGPRPRQRGEEDVGLELEEDVDDAQIGDPHGVGQRVGLADDDALVVEREPGRVLERDRAGAGAGADEDGHAVDQVRRGVGGERLGAVGRPDDHHELGAGHRLAGVVAGVADGGEALEVTAGGDAAGLLDRAQVRAELRVGEERHLVAVLREVERRRESSVPRSEHGDAHIGAP